MNLPYLFFTNSFSSFLPIHQTALMSSLVTLPIHLAKKSIPVVVPFIHTSEHYSVFCSKVLTFVQSFTEEICPHAMLMIENGFFSVFSKLLLKPKTNISFSALSLMVALVLNISEITPYIIEESYQFFLDLFSMECAAEAASIIATHFARLSASMLPVLEKAGALKFFEHMIKNRNKYIQNQAFSFLAHYASHKKLSNQYVDQVFPYIFERFKSKEEGRSHAAFALANLLYQHPTYSSEVIPALIDITSEWSLEDMKFVEYVVTIISNIIRSSDFNLSALIQNGTIERTIRLLNNDNISELVFYRFLVLCKYEEGKKYLKGNKGVRSIISKLTKSSSENLQKNAQNLLTLIDI